MDGEKERIKGKDPKESGRAREEILLIALSLGNGRLCPKEGTKKRALAV